MRLDNQFHDRDILEFVITECERIVGSPFIRSMFEASYSNSKYDIFVKLENTYHPAHKTVMVVLYEYETSISRECKVHIDLKKEVIRQHIDSVFEHFILDRMAQ